MRISMKHRKTISKRETTYTQVAFQADQGVAGIFLKQTTVARLLSKRRPGKASARLPNAALNAFRYTSHGTKLVTWYLEVSMVLAEVGTILPQIQVHHKYKRNGRDPAIIGSHRPLGLAGPLLPLL